MWFPQSALTLICLSSLCSCFVVRRGRRQPEFCGVADWRLVFLGTVSRGTIPHEPDPRTCAPCVIVAMIVGLRETMHLLHRDFAAPRLTQVTQQTIARSRYACPRGSPAAFTVLTTSLAAISAPLLPTHRWPRYLLTARCAPALAVA